MGDRASLTTDLLQGVQVMVVDDDGDARELLHAVLEYCGAHVIVVESARAALATLSRVQPDVIVSDIVMPGADGYALVRALRTRAAQRHVPVVALTAYGLAHEAQEALSAGFSAYLRKPVEPRELCRLIASLRPPAA